MLTILFIHIVGLLSPGPDFFYVSRKAAGSDAKTGIYAAIGIGIGISLWAGLAVFGLGFINNLTVQSVIMVLGGSYLMYIGWLMLNVRENAQVNAEKAANHLTAKQEIIKGMFVNLSNAKAAVFFSSVIAGFLDNMNSLGDMIALFVMFIVVTALYFMIIALLFSRRPIRDFYARYSRYIDNIAGVIFLFFGGSLIFEGAHYIVDLITAANY